MRCRLIWAACLLVLAASALNVVTAQMSWDAGATSRPFSLQALASDIQDSGQLVAPGSSGTAWPFRLDRDRQLPRTLVAIDDTGIIPEQDRRSLQQSIYKVCSMYGWDGEDMSPTGRLGDWSWAGYQMGEIPIPDKPATLDLKKNFGAKGDGNTSDTKAFTDAFNNAPSGAVLYLPPGRYVLDKQITRTKPLVIRGAGRDQTTIYISKSLSDVLGPWNADGPGSLSRYRDGPFFINFAGYMNQSPTYTLVGNVTADASRGDTTIVISMKPGMFIKAGQAVRIIATDRQYSLISYLYGLTITQWKVTDIRDASSMVNGRLMSYVTPVKSAVRMESAAGTLLMKITLMKPLVFDLRPHDWDNVQVHILSSALTESGLEDMTIEFPPSPYRGHFKETGLNAISFSGVVNCWARRMRFINHDYALHVDGSALGTFDDIIMTANTNRGAGNGDGKYAHHHVALGRVTDWLTQNVQVVHSAFHDATVDHQTSLCVYHNISSPDLSCDFHSSAPTYNLYSYMGCGKCSNVWQSGGSSSSGAHAGIGNMIWGLTTDDPKLRIAPPWYNFGNQFNTVGVMLNRVPTYNQFLNDPIPPAVLWPADLRKNQFDRRKANQNMWTLAPAVTIGYSQDAITPPAPSHTPSPSPSPTGKSPYPPTSHPSPVPPPTVAPYPSPSPSLPHTGVPEPVPSPPVPSPVPSHSSPSPSPSPAMDENNGHAPSTGPTQGWLQIVTTSMPVSNVTDGIQEGNATATQTPHGTANNTQTGEATNSTQIGSSLDSNMHIGSKSNSTAADSTQDGSTTDYQVMDGTYE